MQISESLKYRISINYMEMFEEYMDNLIYSLMQIKIYCGSIRPKIENTGWLLTEIFHIEL
jgi:hypothetical protein